MTDMIEVGATAPNFELEGSDGERHRLSDVLAKRRALLVFYPGNNTPG
jgi:peroxiredoxin Q/BCP